MSFRFSTLRGRALQTLGALAVAGALAGTVAAPAGAAGTPRNASPFETSPALVPSPNVSGNRWLGVASFNFSPGQTAQFLHEDCPAQFPIVVNGAFAFNSIGQASTISLGFNGPRIDLSQPYFGEWGWEFSFPGGAPAGLSAQFTIYCVK